MKKKKKSVFQEALNMELREHKSTFRVYNVFRIITTLLMIGCFISKNYESGFLCILTLALLLLPSFFQVALKVELPTVLEVILLCFAFAAEILGEIFEFYIIFPFWDTILHTLNGFLAAAIGFSLVDLLNKSDKLVFDLSPLFTVIVAFCFSMTSGVIWEFFEFGMDQFFGLDMQKDTIIHSISTVALDPSGGNARQAIQNITDVVINGESLGLGGYLDIGLIDTMGDLIVNFIGAAVFSVLAYVYVKTRGKRTVVSKFVLKKKDEDKDYLKIAQDHEN